MPMWCRDSLLQLIWPLQLTRVLVFAWMWKEFSGRSQVDSDLVKIEFSKDYGRVSCRRTTKISCTTNSVEFVWFIIDKGGYKNFESVWVSLHTLCFWPIFSIFCAVPLSYEDEHRNDHTHFWAVWKIPCFLYVPLARNDGIIIFLACLFPQI